MSEILRLDDHRFANLPDFTFTPHFLEVADARLGLLRMHYVDEGPREAPVVLMLHGNPTWSYLYRRMIGPIAAAGYRAVAPDMIGFGRSDKLAERDAYDYDRFVGWMRSFIEQLDLGRILLVAQDWGGPIGFRLLSEMTDRFNAVVATNTLLPNCEPPPYGVKGWPGQLIEDWVATCRTVPDLPIAELIAGASVTRPAPEVLTAYEAPFPDAATKAAINAITGLIPIRPDMPGVAENRRAWQVLDGFDRPFVTAFSDGDPSTIAWESVFQQRVPGARNRQHHRISNAGHFVQEEQGEALAEVVLGLLREMEEQRQTVTGEPGRTGW